MKKFEVIKNNYKWSNYLLIADDLNSGLRIDTADEMRLIAQILINKADEIERETSRFINEMGLTNGES